MLVYDAEIIKCIPNGEPSLDYEYCGGWDDFENMGISVIGYYSNIKETKGFNYCLAPFSSFLELISSDRYICGFNSKQFDDNLCKANGIKVKTTYDLLEEIRIAAFGSPLWQDTPKGHSYSLDAMARANGYAKTGSGALAPQLWQEGKHKEVINYCINDVKLTVELLNLGLKGKLINPNNGEYLKLRPL